MSKFPHQLFFVLFTVFFASGCVGSRLPSENVPVQPFDNTRLEIPDKDAKAKSGSLNEQSVKVLTADYTRLFGLVPIEKSTSPGESEIRIWLNVGLPPDEKLVRIRLGPKHYEAQFFDLGEIQSATPKFDKRILKEPKGGWQQLKTAVESRLRASVESSGSGIQISRHEGIFVVEAVESQQNFLLFDGQHSRQDGMQPLFELCGYISSEFGLELDCRGTNTALGPIT